MGPDLAASRAITRRAYRPRSKKMNKIWNHYTPNLSALDLEMVRSVPPGGNWKDIPLHIPSKRLDQIRESYKAGKGSRSTYYGRLHADRPSYTISTYFNRPGNGCHVHFDFEGGQHRVISQREAARLQSFPDSFRFFGSRGAVNSQIGNAVPPLLSYQVALQLGEPGSVVDLFSGAGGLSLGFAWAGWHSIVANDVDQAALETYRSNIHDRTVAGDIRDSVVFDQVVQAAQSHSNRPLFLLGGPPCQGFSTAGNRRTMDDDRNLLFRQYRNVLSVLEPEGFLFENVPGILSMEGGKVFDMIRSELENVGYETQLWKLRTETYGIPQRRTRVLLLGQRTGSMVTRQVPRITALGDTDLIDGPLAKVPSVRDALGDLPPLKPGEDGSDLDYSHPPVTPYQEFMRGDITPENLIQPSVRGAACD